MVSYFSFILSRLLLLFLFLSLLCENGSANSVGIARTNVCGNDSKCIVRWYLIFYYYYFNFFLFLALLLLLLLFLSFALRCENGSANSVGIAITDAEQAYTEMIANAISFSFMFIIFFDNKEILRYQLQSSGINEIVE